MRIHYQKPGDAPREIIVYEMTVWTWNCPRCQKRNEVKRYKGEKPKHVVCDHCDASFP